MTKKEKSHKDGDNKNENINGEDMNSDTIEECVEKNEESQKSREPIPVTITDIELETLKNEATEYKDKYLRLLAEMENTRKRLQKERQELVQYAIQNVIVDFLNPIDHMENALNYTDQMSDQIKHWATGFKMIMDQFKDVLSTQGVTVFKSVGTEFNPHSHEAIEMIETDEYPAGTVVEESIKGYKMGDKIIRPARVKVAKSQSTQEEK